MKLNALLSLLLTAIVVLLSGCSHFRPSGERLQEAVSINLARQSENAGYGLISTDELAALFDQKEPFLLVDVRKPGDFRLGHIPGAINFTFPKDVIMSGDWSDSLMKGVTEQDFQKLLGDNKGMLLIFSCGRTTCARGHNAAMWAVRLGYHNVFRHPGGVDAWKEAGLPFEKDAK
ncbi:rhodanese-like domain-containing protein [Endozoicomonas sp. OPT23]|uniref:rhodanese-like domain-containing protein n=1 Tax=Endozoicomonas sp. OPT23 TaxID=2072845 RepID=UPI0018918EBF|nr:rhodanese-like domain-containing protein [Endozoicomonas sp. OPT23]